MLAATFLTAKACLANTTYIWDSSGANPKSPVDGSGNWNTTTAANWSTGSADVKWPASGTANTAIIGSGGAAGTITITSPVATNSVIFDPVTGSYTVAASGAGGLTLNGSAPTISVLSGLPTISAPISGVGPLTIGGQTGVTLTGTNTYTGGTILDAGIAIGSDAAINNGAGGVTFNGGLLQFNGTSSNLSFSNAGVHMALGVLPGVTTTLNGNITGSASPSFYGPGTLTLMGTNTYNGPTGIYGGTLQIGSSSALSTGAITDDSALAFDLDVTDVDLTVPQAISGNGMVIQNSSRITTLTASNSYTGGTVLDNGILAITSDAAVNNGVGGFSFNGGVLQLNNYVSSLSFADEGGFMYLGAATGAPSTLAGNITGNTNFIFNGPGTLVLAGQYTYNGNTYVTAGTLIVGNGTTLPTVGGFVLYGGTLAISSDNQIGNDTSNLFFVSPGAVVQFQNYASSLAFDNVANLGLGAATGAASSLSGAITGSSGLGYYGPGSLTLTGSNSYTGPTNVNAGTLVIGAAPALATGTAITIGTDSTDAKLQLAKNIGSGTVSSLMISAGSTLDITNNSLAIDYGTGNPSPIASIFAAILSGYHDGAWNGMGIISSVAATHSAFAVGYADGSTDGGVVVPAGEVLIKYTLLGDANLDGTVNLTDLLSLLNNYGQSGKDWADGDFNYDGTVNLTDLLALLNNYGQSAGQGTDAPMAVPEPAGLTFLVVGGTMMARRRRTNSTWRM